MKALWKKISLFVLVIILLLSLTIGCNKQVKVDNQKEENSVEQKNEAVEEIESKAVSEEVIFLNIDKNLIDSKFPMEIISELSSEKYKGRLTGTEGNYLAVDYIVNQFKEIGLVVPQSLEDYKQYYSQKTIITESAPTFHLIDDNDNKVKEFNFLTDFRLRTLWSNTKIKGEVTSHVYLVDKIVKLKDTDELKGKALLIDKSIVEKYNGPFGVVDELLSLDVPIDAVIINYDVRSEGVYPVSRYLKEDVKYNNEDGPIILYCTDDAFNDIKSEAQNGCKVNISADYTLKEVEVPNVVGIIPGTDEVLKDEFIIIGAHLDHVGDNKNGTYNPGAYDNASGVSGFLEIAKVLNTNKIKPKKSIIFIAFNGEEEHLYGSSYYVKNSVYPLDKSIMINLDCIGVNTDVPLEIEYNSILGKKLSEEFNELAGELEIKSNSNKGGSSDHVPFDKKGVKAVLLIDWDPALIHSIKDTVENKISEERLAKTIELVLYYIDKNAF